MQGDANGQAGLLIAVEGADGQIVRAQCRLLRDKLIETGQEVVLLDFPRQEETSSYFVRQYLNGSYGSPARISPYTAALFYALDRYQNRTVIRRALAEGQVVIASHLVGATMAEQGDKIAHPEERRGFFIWLDNLEMYVLGASRPTRTFVLHTLANADQPANSKVYDEICHLFPRDFTLVDGVRNDTNIAAADLHAILWGKLEPLLPASAAPAEPVASPSSVSKAETRTIQLSVLAETTIRRQGTSNAGKLHRSIAPLKGDQWFYVPETFSDATREHYIKTMQELRQLYDDLTDKLSAYWASKNSGDQSETDIDEAVASTLQTALPIATLVSATLPITNKPASATLPEISRIMASAGTVTNAKADFDIASFARDNLPPNYTGESEPVKLVSVWPRNELDLVADFLYEYSDQPLETIQREVANWSYQRKTEVFRTCVQAALARPDANGPLAKTRYSWDIVSDFATLRALLGQTTQNVEWQPLSPRLGYDVPVAVDDAGLTDDYERCFDISLQLHSQLQQVGFVNESQYACLLGHRLRWTASLNLQDCATLTAASDRDFQKLAVDFLACLRESHPILAGCLTRTINGGSEEINSAATTENQGKRPIKTPV